MIIIIMTLFDYDENYFFPSLSLISQNQFKRLLFSTFLEFVFLVIEDNSKDTCVVKLMIESMNQHQENFLLNLKKRNMIKLNLF